MIIHIAADKLLTNSSILNLLNQLKSHFQKVDKVTHTMNIPIATHFAEKEMRTKIPVIEATEMNH